VLSLVNDRYEVLANLGAGGEAQIVKALDRRHDRLVALKIRPLHDGPARDELLREARVLLALPPHPGLPIVREDFFDGDRYVIAMDWIEGTDLEALLAAEGNPGLDPALAIGYLEQVAEALEHLHRHDPPVVHGDVKPANMILTSSGRVVLVDFGLSSTPSDDLRRAGTAGYVAPEVAAGARPTAAADVYSLAATAAVLLTGERLAGGAPAWRGVEPERIPALERIVRRGFATDPARRDASAAAFVARLRRWWGADLPAGTITLVLADASEDEADELARAHGGHAVAPADDGPLILAFASTDDAVAAACELARGGGRAAIVTGPAAPTAGAYRNTEVVRILEQAARGQVLVDDATVTALDRRLPPDTALAELPAAWAVVAPGLEIPPRAGTCPYRGLIAFEPEDGDVFFGREEIVASIVDRLAETQFIGVVGASGSGKSSLVRAGVVPAHPGEVAVVTPGSDPEDALRRALAGAPSLLVADQLEEVFTLCRDDGARARFFDALMDATASMRVLVVLRADFYGHCAAHPRVAAALAGHQHLLGPMRSDELRRAIEGPARAAGLRFEPGVVDALLADVEGEPGGLPLLSHALYETWARRDGRVLTRAGYLAAGGVRGAIAQTAEEVYLGCSEPDQAVVRATFLQLTELREATEDTRRRVPLDELGHADVLERLAAARLLVVGDGSAEIAHEALIREWPRLRGWLVENRDELRARRGLTAAARAWDAAGRGEEDLLRGPRLAAAAELAGGDRLAPVERDFLAASEDAQERALRAAQRRARRLRVLLALVAAALVVAMAAGAFALDQRGSARHTARVAQAGRLAAQSREVANDHPDLGLLLALEADRLDDSVDTRGALLGALEHGARIRAWLQGFDAPVNATAFSPDGTLLATVTQDRTTLWDTSTWRRSDPPLRSAQGRGEGVDFSPDGRTLAVAGGEGSVELWDVATRRKLLELPDPAAATSSDPALSAVRYSPDGKVIAAGGQSSNHVTVWDAASGRVLAGPITTNPPGGGAQSIAFSPDSKHIAVPGRPGTVGIWDVATGRRVGRPLRIGREDVDEAIYADRGRALIVSDGAGAVSVVDAASGRAVHPAWSVGSKPAAALSLSPDGRLLAAASFEGPVFVWDTRSGQPYGAPLRADTSPGNDVAFSPDGRTLVSAHVGSAVAWRMDGSQAIGAPLGRTGDLVSDVAFSPDGAQVAAGRFDGGTTVYDTATRRRLLRLPGDRTVTSVAFAPAGGVVGVATIDGKVRLFDAHTGAEQGRPLDFGDASVWNIAFSPGGKLLAVAVDPNGLVGFNAQERQGTAELWDVSSRRRVGRAIAPGGGSVVALAFSPDGALLATGSYFGRLDLWNVGDQTRHGASMRIRDDGIMSVAFDASGRLVVGGGAIGPVRVWRVTDQRPAFPPLAGHTGPVTGLGFDRAGTYLASTSLFGGTRLWEPETGLAYSGELAPDPDLSALTRTIDLPFLGLGNALSPDGKRLAVAGIESRAMLWEVDPAVWRRRACAIAGRNLTPEEWRLYLPAASGYRATCREWPTS
jgi:WD40 repeat protein/tRNA A-37 threonylcarbamoyl transferase component Bud32/energy-coupling factor transporter ATP-binding protein EcfA2